MSVSCPNQEWITICTAIAKNTAENEWERLFTSADLAFLHLQRLFWSLTLDLSYDWNKWMLKIDSVLLLIKKY